MQDPVKDATKNYLLFFDKLDHFSAFGNNVRNNEMD